ncbi:hypothetical protein PGT21_007365 [Puccinia graminis f. sp. tritici]|uniref:Uncharacterized protein n=2 Tax=Puccinia graminis f. sp. tritici TaxID=56615 RepID=E3KA42_PUCGT|nr:uncharacterized protein PGTG_07276 [Puccinia graminis f. sp. tritici CRL 75-36-700-3]EFP81024.1 hypothetical protein PGTG_07276 [Puccinia graminis f. sp. tritici CRL 75-36-700-3]KAA1068971.1 hypothetical protein PGT21_007365 [Puccinia graminis f. sp. tritici]
MEKTFRVFFILSSGAQVCLGSLWLPSTQSLEATQAGVRTADRLHEGSNVRSMDLNLNLPEERASNTSPVESEQDAEPREIDFLGSWGKTSSNESGSNMKRPFPPFWEQLPHNSEENASHLHRGKKFKPTQSLRAVNFFPHHHLEFSDFPDQRSPETGDLSDGRLPFSAIADESVTHKDLHPSPHLERPIPSLPSDGTGKGYDTSQEDILENSNQGTLVDLTENSDQGANVEISRANLESHAVDHVHQGKTYEATGTGETRRQAQLKEDQINLKNISPVLLAWLYNIKIGLTDSLHKEITDDTARVISNFAKSLAFNLNALIHRNQNPREDLSMEEWSSHESSHNFKEFVHLLWSINSKFIRTFQPMQEDYIDEQIGVQSWLLDLLKEVGKADSASMQIEETEGLTNLLKKALTSSYSPPIYSIYYNHNISLPSGTVCPSQILMTEAVLNVLASYYKSTNFRKWEALFSEDEDFVKALNKMMSWNAGRVYVIRATSIIESEDQRAIFPWKNRLRANSKFTARNKRMPFFGGGGDSPIDGKIVAIERPADNRNIMMTDFKPKDKWLLEEHPDKPWALISSIETYYNKFVTGSHDPPYYGHIFRKLRSVGQESGERTSNLRSIHDAISQHEFYSNAKRLLQLIWKINSRFVESLGYSANGHIFHQEQHDLEIEFFQLMTLSKPPQSPNLYSQSPTIENSAFVQQKLIEALRSEDVQLIYKIKKSKHCVSRKQILMTKAAVEVISIYYWKKNPSKWLQVFQDEERFVLSLAQIASRILRKQSFDHYMDHKHTPIRQLELLPWKDLLIQSHKQNCNLKLLIGSYCSSQNMFEKVLPIS